MKSPAGILVAASSVLLTIVPVRRLAGQSDRPAEGHWGCFSGYENDPIYVTPAWDGTATMNEVQAAFAEQLLKQYGYKGRVSCSRATMSGSTLAGVQAGREEQFAQWEKNGKKVVHTRWIYGSATQQDTATSAAASSRRPETWAVCRMKGVPAGPKQNYVSGVMEPPANIAPDSLERAFAGFLGKKYGVTRRNAECGTSASRTDALAGLKAWMDEAAKHRATDGPTIETGWVYTPPPSS